jgi:hypothetical protein
MAPPRNLVSAGSSGSMPLKGIRKGTDGGGEAGHIKGVHLSEHNLDSWQHDTFANAGPRQVDIWRSASDDSGARGESRGTQRSEEEHWREKGQGFFEPLPEDGMRADAKNFLPMQKFPGSGVNGGNLNVGNVSMQGRLKLPPALDAETPQFAVTAQGDKIPQRLLRLPSGVQK